MKILRIPQNLVLIKPDDDYKNWGIKGLDGEDLMIPLGAATKNDPYDTDKHKELRGQQAQLDAAQHVSTTGIVVRVPETIGYNGDKIDRIMKRQGVSIDIAPVISELRARSMHFNVPMDLIPGDRVIFKYIEQFNCFKEGRSVEENFEKMILMYYDCIILAIRDGKPIMLNGNILIEPVINETEADKLASMFSTVGANGLLQPLKKELKSRKMQIGRVKFLGSKCDGYLDYPKEKDDDTLCVDDVVVFDPRNGISLEHEYHREFHYKRLIRMQRKDILIGLGNGENILDLKKIKI